MLTAMLPLCIAIIDKKRSKNDSHRLLLNGNRRITATRVYTRLFNPGLLGNSDDSLDAVFHRPGFGGGSVTPLRLRGFMKAWPLPKGFKSPEPCRDGRFGSIR